MKHTIRDINKALEGKNREARRKSDYIVVDLRENEIVGCFSDLEEFARDLEHLREKTKCS
jgi:hypothetical protein